MSTASPTAYLLWAILAVLFLCFLIYHLWSYDKFRCLHWSAGRQPGAFKRVMTYSYLASVPLLVIYSIATTVIKFKEGWLVLPDNNVIPKPLNEYNAANRGWIVPLGFVFCFAWGLELITHLEELAFWLYLLHQRPQKAEWFESWEYRMWYMGSMTAFIGMPLTALVARRNVLTLDAYIFLVGSSGSTGTTLLFLYVLWSFPKFLKHVKAEGADPTVVVRLTTFYQLNLARVVFRFLFTVPLLIVAVDGLVGTKHRINRSVFWTDFLLMIAGIGCFVSTTITLLIFFPRSFTKEAGYKPKPPTSVGPESPRSAPITPPSMLDRSRQFSAWNIYPSPSMQFPVGSPAESHWGSQYCVTDPQALEDGEEGNDEQYAAVNDHVPPYASHITQLDHPDHAYQPSHRHGPAEASSVQVGMQHSYPEQAAYQRQPFPHSVSSPYVTAAAFSPPPPPSPIPVPSNSAGELAPVPPSLHQVPSRTPTKRHSKRRTSVNQPTSPPEASRHPQGQVHRFGGGNPYNGGNGPGGLAFTVPDEGSTPSLVKSTIENDMLAQAPEIALRITPSHPPRSRRPSHRRATSTLHPYVMTFTSPIDLADLNPPPDVRDLPRTTI